MCSLEQPKILFKVEKQRILSQQSRCKAQDKENHCQCTVLECPCALRDVSDQP